MTAELVRFAKKYSRLLYIFNSFVTVVPAYFRPAFIFALGRFLSPFKVYSKKITHAICSALPGHDTGYVWRRWLDSHGRFVLDFLMYRKLDTVWLKNKFTCSDQPALDALRKSGGLLLTYHTHHQNTLCCALGLQGIKVSAVAASPHDSPLFPYIGTWATKVNVDSARHFNGGDYIFTNNLRYLLNTTQKCFASGDVVVSLCDFHQPKAECVASGRLFGRCVSPPTGVIEMALKHKVPIFLALLAPTDGKLCLQIERLAESNDLNAVVAQYFCFLELNIRANPACWQGWEWFEDLPKTL